MSIQPPPVPTIEEDLDDLGYTEENLFDEREQEPLEEYVNMESTLEGGGNLKSHTLKPKPLMEAQKKGGSIHQYHPRRGAHGQTGGRPGICAIQRIG